MKGGLDIRFLTRRAPPPFLPACLPLAGTVDFGNGITASPGSPTDGLAWVAQVTSAGVVEWADIYESSMKESPAFDMDVDGDGNIYLWCVQREASRLIEHLPLIIISLCYTLPCTHVSGYFGGTLSISGLSAVTANGEDGWLLKLSNNGTAEWIAVVTGTGFQSAQSVSVQSDGTAFMMVRSGGKEGKRNGD